MSSPSTRPLTTVEHFIGITLVSLMIATQGLVLLGMQVLVSRMLGTDPMMEFILTIGANIMFGLAVAAFVILSAVIIWKRILRF